MGVPDERMPTLSSAVEKLMRRKLAEVHTCLPGRIVKYTQATQLADVEICVKYRTPTDDGDTIIEEFPVIPNVPVEHQQTTGFFASFPVAAGDFVWLHIIEQSIDKWLQLGSPPKGGIDDPIDRRFNLKDCFATLARNPKTPIAQTENDCMVLGPKGSGPRVYLTNSIIGLGAKAPSEFVALATKVDNLIATINTWGAGHTHSGVTTGGGSSGTPATGPFPSGPSSSAATKVKAV